jgi:hypothetical protein
VDGFGAGKSHFISELLHEVVENLVVTLDRGLCFVEDVLAKPSPCKELLSLGAMLWRNRLTKTLHVRVMDDKVGTLQRLPRNLFAYLWHGCNSSQALPFH